MRKPCPLSSTSKSRGSASCDFLECKMPQFVAEIHKAMPLHRRAVLLRLGTNARMIGGHAIRSCRFSISPPDGGPSILSVQEAQRESILHALTPNGAVDFLLEFGFRYAGCVCNVHLWHSSAPISDNCVRLSAFERNRAGCPTMNRRCPLLRSARWQRFGGDRRRGCGP